MVPTKAGERAFREVMTFEPDAPASPLEQATVDFVFGHVWNRPGLSRRERRWVTLACVAAADAPDPMIEHIYAALNSGDVQLPEMLEFVLQFAVYCGWPKASCFEGHLRTQWARIHQERGEPKPPWPLLATDTLGPNDFEVRLQGGEREFRDVNFVPAPSRDSPYNHAGILNFVFGHVWQRPNLSRRERRLITVTCVAIDDSPLPLQSHVGSALQSRDISTDEMAELALHFAMYYGFAKGQQLNTVAQQQWARIMQEEREPGMPADGTKQLAAQPDRGGEP
jgi:4-carboxymuconolactone decarboxylase